MNPIDLTQRIYDLNISYMFLAQDLIKENKTSALFRLGIDDGVADILARLTPSQIIKISGVNQLIVDIRFNHGETLNILTKESRLSGIQQLHTSILLSRKKYDNSES